jgi:hypothetical protein
VSRLQIPGLYPDPRGQDARDWLDVMMHGPTAPVDAHTPTPAEGVPTVRVPPVLWRVTGIVAGSVLLDQSGAPEAAAPLAAARAWADRRGQETPIRVRVARLDDPAKTLDIDLSPRRIYDATIVGAAS